ncbi:hypothetical protein V5P93_003343 [Actinokineospora auranticolor]|uniref:hypothetical protein n=1 Tax=Actinokineospora auranticolor TaxID=155976 RepID=UPI0011AFF290|nr:hypothetical protein [Actinokineospora auranticolor]
MTTGQVTCITPDAAASLALGLMAHATCRSSPASAALPWHVRASGDDAPVAGPVHPRRVRPPMCGRSRRRWSPKTPTTTSSPPDLVRALAR